jgi:hypothetical protein
MPHDRFPKNAPGDFYTHERPLSGTPFIEAYDSNGAGPAFPALSLCDCKLAESGPWMPDRVLGRIESDCPCMPMNGKFVADAATRGIVKIEQAHAVGLFAAQGA